MLQKEFEFCQIDPNNCSIEELKAEIQRLENIKDEYNGLQHSIKIGLIVVMVLVHLFTLLAIM